MKTAYKALLFTLLLAYSLTSFAIVLDEGFVFLRISKHKGNKFYRVLMTEDEVPYIDVENILAEYLDLAEVSCDMEEQYCSGTLTLGEITYWINAKSLTYGNSENINDISIPNGGAIEKEGKIWLRYDLLQDWLRVTPYWSLGEYILSITPKFKLLYQKKHDVEIRRKAYAQRKKELEEIQKISPIESGSNVTSQAKISVDIERPIYQSNKKIELGSNIQTTTDIYRGTLSVDGSLSTNEYQNNEYYWNYKTNDRLGMHLIELGDTTIDRTSLLIPNIGIKNGLKIQRLKNEIINGLYTIKGRAEKGAEVDILHNGILIKSVTVKEDGEYEAEDILVAGNDSITIEILHPDGRNEAIHKKITPDKSLILPWNTFNFNGSTGVKSNAERVYYTNLRYGLLNHFSIGVHYIQDNDDMAEGITIADAAWKPFPTLLMMYEGAQSKDMEGSKTRDHSFALNIETIKYNFFQLKYFNVNTGSPMLSNRTLSKGVSKQLLHKLSFYNFLWENRIYKSEDYFSTQSTVTKVIGRKLNVVMSLEQDSIEQDSDIDTLSGKINYSPNLMHRLSLSHNFISNNKSSTFVYEYRERDSKRPLNGRISLIYSERMGLTESAEFSWNFTKKLALSCSTDGEDVGAKLSFIDVFSPIGKSISNRKEYAQGIIYGKIIPPPGTSADYNLENIEVKAGRSKTKSDEKGNYLLKGVATNSPLKVSINPNSTDITMAQKDEFKVVKLRPASNIELDIELTQTVGIDGVLVTSRDIPLQSKIEIKQLSTGKILNKDIEVEEDGFFLIENIPTGEYELRLINLPKDRPSPPAKTVKISKGEDWISDLRWDWD